MRGRDVLVAAALLWLLARRKRAEVVPMTSPSVIRWMTPLLVNGAGAVAPIPFLLSWIRVESGGNPCAVGELNKLDVDGQPWEVSIWQLDPDNRRIAGATAAELRPCCSNRTGSTRAVVERCERELTDLEVASQIRAGVKYIAFCRSVVDRAVAATGTGWTYPGVDYLRAVKSVHGAPWVMGQGLAIVKARLGRPPATFQEVADSLRSAVPSSWPMAPGVLIEVLNNAIKTWPAAP